MSSPTLAHAQSHVSTLLQNSPLYALLIPTITVASATPGRVACHLTLQRQHLNSHASLHGSTTATLVDFIGGVAIATHDSRDKTGVSLNIDIQYIGGAKEGETIEVIGTAEKVGGSVAFTRIVVRKVRDLAGTEWESGTGPLVATGSHTKFVQQRTAR